MTYYEVLEIDSRATTEEIERSYRRLARQVHPDLSRGDRTQAEARMKLLNEIRDTLTDPLLRAGYDERLRLEEARRDGAPPEGAAFVPEAEPPPAQAEGDARRDRGLWAGLFVGALGAGVVTLALVSRPAQLVSSPEANAPAPAVDAATQNAPPLLVSPVAPKHAAPGPIPAEERPARASSRGRFIIRVGSTADEVLQRLGPPDRYEPGRRPGESVLRYGRLRLEIRNGRVVGGDAAP